MLPFNCPRRIAGRLAGPLLLAVLTTLAACDQAPRGPAGTALAEPRQDADFALGSDPGFMPPESGGGP